MAEQTIPESIDTRIQYQINQIPQAELVTIHKTYTGNYADVKTDTDDILEYLPVIGNPIVGHKAILLPLKRGKYAVITGGE